MKEIPNGYPRSHATNWAGSDKAIQSASIVPDKPYRRFCRSSMADSKMSKKLSTFLESGIYRFEDSNAVFVDPVRVLNRSYNRFKVSPSAYYSRFFESKHTANESSNSRKRKRKQKKNHTLNERERAADQRHQVIVEFNLRLHYVWW